MSLSEEFQDRSRKGCGLFQVRRMASRWDCYLACVRQQCRVAVEISLRHQTVAFAAHEQRRGPDAMQPPPEFRIVHPWFPGEQCQGLARAKHSCKLYVRQFGGIALHPLWVVVDELLHLGV